MRWSLSMTLEAIRQAIAGLPEVDKASVVAWLSEQNAKAWGRQIVTDFSEGGAGESLLQAWDAEVKAGGSMPLEEFLAQEEAARKTK